MTTPSDPPTYPTRITRKELHRRVWATPVSRLAGEFGISGRGLGKICASRDIPVPPRGWWARRAAQRTATIQPLPTTRPADEIILIGHGSGARRRQMASEVSATVPAITVIIPDRLDAPSPPVAATRRAMTRRPREDGLLYPRRNSAALDLRVSPAQLDRALRILEGVSRALEECGLAIRIDREERVSLIEGLEETVTFALFERMKHVPYQPTQADLRRKASSPWITIPETVPVPAGRLTLAITNAEGLGIRQRWADGKVQRLETLAGKFIEGVYVAAHALRSDRERKAAWQRHLEEMRRQREQEQRDAALYSAREAYVLDCLKAWRRARDIRVMIEEFEGAITHSETTDRDDRNAWTEWARLYADRIDPSKGSLTNFPVEVKTGFDGWS
tara:strand:- start:6494 stop:7663 length:1170 start_codon:yes stop_codon:yes gene_type:complete